MVIGAHAGGGQPPATAAEPADRHKWVALTNTTVGVLLATIDASIMIIAMPDIFRGIGLDPLVPGNSTYLLWMILGYLVTSSVLLVSVGRLGDLFGRVRMSILFASFLGYNPVQHLLGPGVLRSLPAASASLFTGRAYFPALISGPFRSGRHVAFAFSITACLIAAAASWSGGKRYVAAEHELGAADITAEIETDVATDA